VVINDDNISIKTLDLRNKYSWNINSPTILSVISFFSRDDGLIGAKSLKISPDQNFLFIFDDLMINIADISN
jgi:hypothetical protein